MSDRPVTAREVAILSANLVRIADKLASAASQPQTVYNGERATICNADALQALANELVGHANTVLRLVPSMTVSVAAEPASEPGEG